ncbi:hypothetical protein Trydic_g19610 [Trypoxylus dichotomus]
MKGFQLMWTVGFVWTIYVATATEGVVVANNPFFPGQHTSDDTYRHHYRSDRDQREIPTRQGRRWEQTETTLSSPIPDSPYNSISVEQDGHNKRHRQEQHRHHHQKQETWLAQQHQTQSSPIFFHSPNYTVVQAQTRTTAILHCEVTNIGNNTVTWKRRRDYQILTFGILTYSSDNRFFTRSEKNGKDWCLHIKYVQPDDAGLYECQVTSHPPASIFVDLQLVEARAEIIGGPDKIVKSGSPLVLSCLLRRSTEQPEYIFWYHGERMINYDLGGGATVRHGRQGSELLIPKADVQHAGNYSCVPSNAKPVSVNVHVLHIEKPAAMQHGSKNASASMRDRRADATLVACIIVTLATSTIHLLQR